MTPSLDKIALPACQRATEPTHLLGHVLALIGSPCGGPLSCRVAVGGGGSRAERRSSWARAGLAQSRPRRPRRAARLPAALRRAILEYIARGQSPWTAGRRQGWAGYDRVCSSGGSCPTATARRDAAGSSGATATTPWGPEQARRGRSRLRGRACTASCRGPASASSGPGPLPLRRVDAGSAAAVAGGGSSSGIR
jgi:hypothetical protein